MTAATPADDTRPATGAAAGGGTGQGAGQGAGLGAGPTTGPGAGLGAGLGAGPADTGPRAGPGAAVSGAGPAGTGPGAGPDGAGPGLQDGGSTIGHHARLIVAAALPHVAFDGWSDATLRAAAAEVGMPLQSARALFARGGIDLAVAAHRIGDEDMRRRLAAADLAGLRFRDRIALALNLRIAAAADRESVRRASALFALPHLLPTGAALVWGTADAIWTALGDTSRDGNWYTKRATLAAVWTATVLYWLGDTSAGGTATRDFIDRRIAEVMRFEATKARARDMAVLRPVTGALSRLMAGIAAPGRGRDDLPGRWTPAGDAPDA